MVTTRIEIHNRSDKEQVLTLVKEALDMIEAEWGKPSTLGNLIWSDGNGDVAMKVQFNPLHGVDD